MRAFGGQLEISRAKELRRELVEARGPRPRLFKDSTNKEGLGVSSHCLEFLCVTGLCYVMLLGGSTNYCGNSISGEQEEGQWCH